MTKCNLKIKHNTDKKFYSLTVDYKDFERRLNELSRTNIFFSTYLYKEQLHGFIKLNVGFYVRLLIVHRLGSIVKIAPTIQNKNLIKMKVCTEKSHLVFSIFESVFNKMGSGFYETKYQIHVLSDFYVDLAIASNSEIIEQKWNEGATLNRDSFQKDFVESQVSRFKLSQKMDGGRNQLEFLAGSGSNIGGKARLGLQSNNKKQKTKNKV